MARIKNIRTARQLTNLQDTLVLARNRMTMMNMAIPADYDQELMDIQDEIGRAELREKYIKRGCGCMVRIQGNESSDKPLGLYVDQAADGLVEISLPLPTEGMPLPNVFMHRSRLEYYLNREWRDLYMVERE